MVYDHVRCDLDPQYSHAGSIGRRNAIRFIMARGEAGGGHMADAYARVSGELGVFYQYGTGCGQCCGCTGGSPICRHPNASSDRSDRDAGMDLGQGAVHDVTISCMLRSVSKQPIEFVPATALGTLVKAASEAMTPPMGPVSIEIPIDIQRTKIHGLLNSPHSVETPIPEPVATQPG